MASMKCGGPILDLITGELMAGIDQFTAQAGLKSWKLCICAPRFQGRSGDQTIKKSSGSREMVGTT